MVQYQSDRTKPSSDCLIRQVAKDTIEDKIYFW